MGTRSPAHSAAWPAQAGPDPGRREWKSDASGRAGGARPRGLEAPLLLPAARRPVVSPPNDQTSTRITPAGAFLPHPIYALTPAPACPSAS